MILKHDKTKEYFFDSRKIIIAHKILHCFFKKLPLTSTYYLNVNCLATARLMYK